MLHCIAAQWFYRWAMREIDPLHPDVPKIIRRQRQLDDKWRGLSKDLPAA